jgi:hypothetical protein
MYHEKVGPKGKVLTLKEKLVLADYKRSLIDHKVY